jgi:hypothetical protein
MAKDGTDYALQHHPWPWFPAFPAGKTDIFSIASSAQTLEPAAFQPK